MTALADTYLDPAVRALCDTLEWLLVPWGRRHVGAVRVSVAAPSPRPCCVWMGPPPTDTAPEARLYREWVDDRPVYTTGGSPAWVLGGRGDLAVRLCGELARHGWAVQVIDAQGVALTAVE